MHKLYILGLLFFVVGFSSCKTKNLDVISESLVKKHLYTLASDEMEGRKAGTPGIEKAAVYIEDEFKRIGLQTFNGAKDYRQRFSKTIKGKELDLFNIIGVLEGKSKNDEYIVVSAHYDHLGIKKNAVNGDSIYNGANDNASGVAAVLALANYFKKKDSNERSILFVTFTAEEMGLVGSNYFGTTIVDPESIIAGVNIEMIGKTPSFGPKTAWLTGFNRSDFGTLVQKNVKGTGYTIHPDPYYPKFNLFFRSDNAALAMLGIPAHTFSTSPADDGDYHKTSDEIETLNIKTITETVKVIALGISSFIDGSNTPSRIILSEKETSDFREKLKRHTK